MDQVGIPWCGRDDGNLSIVNGASESCWASYNYQEENLVEAKTGKQRLVAERQSYRRRYRVLEVSEDGVRQKRHNALCYLHQGIVIPHR